MKPKSKLLSLLLTICLVVGLMPTAAFAAGTDTGKAIQLVDSGTAANIGGGQADNIYFGTYQQSSDGSVGYNTDPIKWRVLENANGQLFLLSDQNLDVFQYHTDSESVTWEKSTMRSWLNGYSASHNTGGDSGTDYTSDNFIGTAFSEKEQGAIVDTTVVNDDNPDYNTEGGENTNDKIFLLSVDEARNSSYFTDDSSRIATNTAYVAGGGKIGGGMLGVGEADNWWLRSPGNDDDIAAYVNDNGGVRSFGPNVDFVITAVRPAFNLNLNSVLFTSAAEGGKSASGMDSGLTAVDDYTGSEWKLTLLDETREFAVTEQTVSGKPGDTITLNYTGATTGENEYISVIIADENGAQYYGRVAQPDSADGQVKIKIPDSLAAGEYTLNVFSEQYNGDYKTDYASAFAEVALTVEEAAAPGIDTGKAIQLVDSGTAANIGGGQADNIYFGTYQQSSDGSGGYNTDPIKWRVLENADGQLFLLSDQNLDVFQYHTDIESVTWETSTMRSWLNGYDASHNTGGDSGIDYTSDNFIGTAFSAKEQAAIADTEVFNDDNPYGTEGGNNTTDQIFLLSIAEAQNSSYFADNSSRIATSTAYVAGGGKLGSSYMNGVGEADYWWLRSPGDNDNLAAAVYGVGGVSSFGGIVDDGYYAVRPAFNLDLTSVLFTSAAVGGKSANGMDSGLTAIGNYDGNEWKLTILDEDRSNFSASTSSQTTVNDNYSDWKITLNYENAMSYDAETAPNEYISVIIADSNGSALYYGRVAQPDSANGQVEIKIPDSLAAGKYTLNVFSEQYNGDYMTDYASAFAEVALTVEEADAPGIDTGKAIQLVDSGTAANISGGQADNLYFGTYQQSSDGNDGYNIDPIKWRVLENAGGQLFLLSDQNLDVFQYHTDLESVTWETSTMRSWLNGYDASHNTGGDSGIDYTSDNFIGTAFSAKEQAAIADTEVFNDDNPYGTEGGNNTTDQIFLLSIAEAQNSSYFADNSSRIATSTAYVAGGGKLGSSYMNGVGEADYWWLRSPGDNDNLAAAVYGVGGVSSFGGIVDDGYYAVRPAFNLDLTSVLFTSAAVGGKSPAAESGGTQGGEAADAIFEISDYSGSEWKLTLLDEAHKNFEISNATMNSSGDTIAFSYSGAQTGEKEYISVVIEDSGAITHYGRILQPGSASGTASFTLPAGVTLSENTKLYVFNEQYNGDKMTDYASALCEVQFDTTAPMLSNGSATRTGETTATVKFTSDEAGTYYYVVDNSTTAPDSIDTSGEGASCSANTETTISLDSLSGEYIHIVVKDADNNVSDILTIQIPAYTLTTFTVTVDVAPSGGGTASASLSTAAPGTEITLTATPSTGYHFKEWQVTEATVSIGGDNKFTMPAGNVTVKAVFEAHSFTQENTDSEYLASSATCTQAATYYYSCSCGAKDMNNTFTSGEALGHTLGADWKYNDSNHWKECEDCGAKVDEAAHVYTDDADTTCNDCGYVKPTYAISASPETLDFGSKAEGYEAAPEAQTVTIKNTGKQSVTVNLPTSTNYIITAGEGFTDDTATLAPNGTAAFTVQPNTGLGVGTYAETLTVSGDNNVSASIELSFTVLETYTLTVDLNGGSGSTIGGEYTAGEVVNIDAGSRSSYRFTGWTTSNGGNFADTSSASTTFTMPAADTTITANWEYNGGGSTGGSTTDYYRLTFDTNGGSEIASILRAEYTTVDLSDYKPTREGYEFTGWYADEDLTEKITSIRLTRNTTVYAGWEEIKENPSTGFENPFTDVSESDWFFNDVKFVYQNGLMNGTSATTFSPEGTTSRGMIVTILWRMAGSPDMEDKIWGYPFADVDATAYYGTAVYWARLNGIAGGYDDATFGPNDPITREQMAVMMYRYAQYMGYDTTQGGMAIREYADYGQVSSYALEAMDWANATGIVTGTSESTLSPQGQATRAQAAAMFTRFCEQYAEK